MKKLTTILFWLFAVTSILAQSNDATLSSYSTVNIAQKPYNPTRADAFNQLLIDSKANIIFGVNSSGQDNYTVSVSDAVQSYIQGQYFLIRFTNGNTGACTIDINSIGSIAIVKNGVTPLEAGDIIAGQYHILAYDGTVFQLVSGNFGGGGGGSGTVSAVAVQAPSAGFTVSGTPITSSGTFTFALANDLAAIESLTSTGLSYRNGADSWNLITTVPTSLGGTGTNLSFTQGSIVFQGAAGYSQDNSNLFWDDSNNRLGLGTTSPQSKIHVISNTTSNFNNTFLFEQPGGDDIVAIKDGGWVKFGNVGQTLLYAGTPGVADLNSQNFTIELSASSGDDLTIYGGAFASVSSHRSLLRLHHFTDITSTNNSLTTLLINPTITNWGAGTGILRGIYYNPTIVNPLGSTHIGLEVASGQVRLPTLTQDQTKTNLLAQDASTGQLFWRTAGTGTVTAVDVVEPVEGLTISGAPIESSGSLEFELADDLAAIESSTGLGFATRTGSDTWANRTLTGSNTIEITDGGGASGDPILRAIAKADFTHTGTTYTIQSVDHGLTIYLTNASGCVVTLPDGLEDDFYVTVVRANGAGTITINATTTLRTIGGENTIESEHGPAVFHHVGSNVWYGWGELGAASGGSGTVTSVGLSVPSFLSVSGSPVTSSGTLAVSYSGTALPTDNGGTGLTTIGSAGQVLRVNGGGTALEYGTVSSSSTLDSYTVSTTPSASPAGQQIFITDDVGGSVPAFSDGTNWRRVTDRAIVQVGEPSVQASNISFTSVSGTSFQINWTSGNGDGRVVLIKAGSAVDSNPVDATTYTANTEFGSGSELGTGNYVVYAGTGSSVSVTGLTSSTTYHVRVYEENGSGGSIDYLTTTATDNPNSQLTGDLFYALYNMGGVGTDPEVANTISVWDQTKLTSNEYYGDLGFGVTITAVNQNLDPPPTLSTGQYWGWKSGSTDKAGTQTITGTNIYDNAILSSYWFSENSPAGWRANGVPNGTYTIKVVCLRGGTGTTRTTRVTVNSETPVDVTANNAGTADVLTSEVNGTHIAVFTGVVISDGVVSIHFDPLATGFAYVNAVEIEQTASE